MQAIIFAREEKGNKERVQLRKKGRESTKKKWLEQMAVMEKTAYFAERRKCR